MERLRWGVGDVVRKLRERRGWSQETLAAEAEVGLSTVKRIESGTASFRNTKLEAIAEALQTTVKELHAHVPGHVAGVSEPIQALLDEGYERLAPKEQRAVRKYVRVILDERAAGQLQPRTRDRE